MINILKAPLILILVLAVFLKSFSQSAADTAGIKKVRALAGTASVYQKSNAAAALNYYQKALALAKSKHLYKQQLAILNNIADLYHQQKDYHAAFNTKAEQYYIADRFILKEMSRRIASLQAADRQEKLDTQAQKLQFASKQHQMEKNGVVSIILAVIVLVSIIIFFFYKTSHLNRLLNKTNAELQESNDVKDKLFSVLGHDLRSPFVSVINMLQILDDENISAEDKKKMFLKLETTSKTSLEVLTNLLKWGEMQIKGVRLNQSTFNLKNIVERNILMLNDMAGGKNIKLVNEVNDDSKIFADADHCEFVIRNLLSNAIKFSYLNGEVVVSALENKTTGHTTISVCDNGMGMNADQVETIFDIDNISTSGTSDEKGTSLGLLLCKEFVALNGGTIKVESAPARGAAFSFTLRSASTPSLV